MNRTEQFADFTHARIGTDLTVQGKDNSCYVSLPLCVIDSVYSIGVRYESTERVVKRYATSFSATYSPNGLYLQPRSEPPRDVESISDLIERMKNFGVNRFCTKIFCNRQWTSTNGRHRIRKAEAVLEFAEVVRAFGLETITDVRELLGRSDVDQMLELLKKRLRAVPGDGADSLRINYVLMMAGGDQFIKADRMLRRFAKLCFGKEVSTEHLKILIEGAAKILRTEYLGLTPRILDNKIWWYQRRLNNRSSSCSRKKKTKRR